MKAILIDDELNCLEILEWSIQKVCPQIEIVEQCQSGTAGIEAIQQYKPDLIFLDIEMRDMTGFDMLEKLNSKERCEVIFTTAYDQFAIDAFKVNAVDYLLKPIDNKDLVKAVTKVEERLQKQVSSNQIEFLLKMIQKNKSEEPNTVAIPTGEGLEFIQIKDIVYLSSGSKLYNDLFFNG